MKESKFVQSLIDTETCLVSASNLIGSTHPAAQPLRTALVSVRESLKFVAEVKAQITLETNRKLRRKELLAQSHLGQVVLKGER
jgi:hypothetical protein